MSPLPSAARADLIGIMEYYAQSDPRIGSMHVDRIEAAGDKLSRFDTGRPGRVPGTREKSVLKTSHVLVYEVHPDRVEVFRVVHTAKELISPLEAQGALSSPSARASSAPTGTLFGEE